MSARPASPSAMRLRKNTSDVAAQNRHRRVFVRDVHEQPVVRRRLRAGEHGVDDVERREIDDSRLRARVFARRLVFANDVFPRHHDDEFGAAVGRLEARACS